MPTFGESQLNWAMKPQLSGGAYCPVTTKRSVLCAEDGKLGTLCSTQEIFGGQEKI